MTPEASTLFERAMHLLTAGAIAQQLSDPLTALVLHQQAMRTIADQQAQIVALQAEAAELRLEIADVYGYRQGS